MSNIRKIFIVVILVLLLCLMAISYQSIMNYSNQKKKNSSDIVGKDTASYGGYTYSLPDDWNCTKDYKEKGVSKLHIYNNSTFCSAVIRIINISVTGYSSEDVLNDYTLLEQAVKNDGLDVYEPKKLQYGEKTVFSFQLKQDSLDAILAYMQVNHDDWYAIRLSCGLEGSFTFDYDTLKTVVNILNTAKK